MTFVVAALMIIALAALIAYPLFSQREDAPAIESRDARELLRHEKDVALMALREADLDRAMGKLSEEDYGTLRGQYEGRALGALAALDEMAEMGEMGETGALGDARGLTRGEKPAAAPSRFCMSCGQRFVGGERYCPGCGHARV